MVILTISLILNHLVSLEFLVVRIWTRVPCKGSHGKWVAGLGGAALGAAGERGEQEVRQEVEPYEADEQPVRLGPGQLGLVQVDGVEDANNPEDLGRVANQPVRPVEDAPVSGTGCGSDESEEGLEEAEADGDEADQRVRVAVERLAHPLDLEDDEDKASDGETPDEHHEGAMPDEPLVEVAAPGRGPRLLVIPGNDDSQARRAHPRGNHEASVQQDEELRLCLNQSWLTETSLVPRDHLRSVLDQPTLGHSALGEHDVELLSAKVPILAFYGHLPTTSPRARYPAIAERILHPFLDPVLLVLPGYVLVARVALVVSGHNVHLPVALDEAGGGEVLPHPCVP